MRRKIAVAPAPSVIGKVKEISVSPVAAAETFWTIMSIFTSASAID